MPNSLYSFLHCQETLGYIFVQIRLKITERALADAHEFQSRFFLFSATYLTRTKNKKKSSVMFRTADSISESCHWKIDAATMISPRASYQASARKPLQRPLVSECGLDRLRRTDCLERLCRFG